MNIPVLLLGHPRIPYSTGSHHSLQKQWYSVSIPESSRRNFKLNALTSVEALGKGFGYCRPTRRKIVYVPRALQAVDSWSVDKTSKFIQEKMEFLKEDLKHLFDDQGIDPTAYDEAVEFVDPITKYDDIKGYLFNIAALRRVFDPDYKLLDLRQTGEFEITTRWSMRMRLSINPIPKYWPAQMLFTGVSILGINPSTGRFNRHIDYWDAIKDQKYFSLEAFGHVLSQLSDVKRTPDLETPSYVVLKKTKHYEIREYKEYLVAETDVNLEGGRGLIPAAKDYKEGAPPVAEERLAFRRLAGYIFGANERKEKIKMTTPVFTNSRGQMQFVMGSQYQSPSQLPRPSPGLGNCTER
eukprot:jgi/Botrbrau1/8575/Bobra.0359s0038.1